MYRLQILLFLRLPPIQEEEGHCSQHGLGQGGSRRGLSRGQDGGHVGAYRRRVGFDPGVGCGGVPFALAIVFAR